METVVADSDAEVGFVIGKNGVTIARIIRETGTVITTPKREDPSKVITIRGSAEGVRRAMELIESRLVQFRDKQKAEPRATDEEKVTVRKEVALNHVGAVIGPRGDTVRRIQFETNTRIVSPRQGESPFFEITGLPGDVKAAQDKIRAICDACANGSTQTGSSNNSTASGSGQWPKTPPGNFKVHADSPKRSPRDDMQGQRDELKRQLEEKDAENAQLRKNLDQLRAFIKEKDLNDAFIEFLLAPRN